MYTFNVTKSGNQLIVTSNTFWNCNVYGNFRLSKYSGSGNATITMSVPKELPDAHGFVVFSYGDERCEYPSIEVFLANDCYIRTEPMYTECPNGNILKLVFKEDGEAVSVKVYSNGIWTINNNQDFKNGDELLISASNGKEVIITPNVDCPDNTKVKVILQKKTG